MARTQAADYDERRLAIVAGNSLPLVDHQARDRAKNARVEIVFLTPEVL